MAKVARSGGTCARGRTVGVILLALGVTLGLAPPPVGAQAPVTCTDGPATMFVCRAYESFARRAATTAEIELWAPQVPARRTSFVATVARGEESRHHTVIAYFQRFGRRDPSTTDHDFWDREILTSAGLRRLEAALLGNDTTTDAELVARAYDVYLGRTASPPDARFWETRIDQIGRRRVAASFANTLEARRTRVTWAYRNELLVTADVAGRDYWAERQRTGTTYLDLRIALRSSPDGYRQSGAACSPSAPQSGPTCEPPA